MVEKKKPSPKRTRKPEPQFPEDKYNMNYKDSDRPIVPGFVKFLIGGVALAIAITIGTMWAFETNYSGWTTVVQAPISGQMTVITTPGLYAQWGGTVTTYKQACTITFGADAEDAGIHDSKTLPPILVQFNDNGTASCYGNVRYELPLDHDKMLLLHNKYRSYDHLVSAMLGQHTANVVGATAQMFSAEETYSGSRAEFQRLAQDQLEHGIYQTDVKEIESEDPVTHEKRRARKVSIRLGPDGKPLRVSSPLSEFNITCSQFLLSKNFDYEKGVLGQIEAQREAFMRTVTARAQAQQATQDVITSKARGEASVTQAEYVKLVNQKEQVVEAETAKKVAETAAEQRKAIALLEKEMAEIKANQALEVAKLEREAAEQTKQKDILLGEGEASRKKAIMEADGALEMKLRTMTEINKFYAEAIGNYRGNWVPNVSMGQSTNGSTNGMSAASDLVNMLMVKTARELALPASVVMPINQTETPK